MKQLFLIGIILLFLTSCKEKPKNPVSEYGDALIDSYKRGQQAAEIANLDALKKVLQVYHAEHGKYPEKLEDIDYLMGARVDYSKYDYNPQTGMVSLKKN